MKRCLLTFALLCCVSAAWAVALPITPLWSGLLDNSGQPLAGGHVYFYKSGTATAKQVWDTATKTGARTYVTLDGYGRAQVYGDMADGYRYDLIVYDASGPTELYRVYGLEVVSTVAPTTLSPKYLTSVVSAEVASLSVSQRAHIASATINVFHLSNGTLIQSDLVNVDIASASLANTFLVDSLDANLQAIENVATPTAAMDAARKYETDALASAQASIPSNVFGTQVVPGQPGPWATTWSPSSFSAEITYSLVTSAASHTNVLSWNYTNTQAFKQYLRIDWKMFVVTASSTHGMDCAIRMTETASSTFKILDQTLVTIAPSQITLPSGSVVTYATKVPVTMSAFTSAIEPGQTASIKIDIMTDSIGAVLGLVATPMYQVVRWNE